MSEVISFRLNKDKHREARAFKILRRWQEEGRNTRYIITEALLRLEDSDKDGLNVEMLAELNEKLDRVCQIFELIEYETISGVISLNQSILTTKLSDGFLTAIKETARSGIKTE